ncbi:MAG: hypothetical protein IPM82_02515 [Saprospiraceae bacterium]|nr:hypothetical protein [Saprospiraceae bacterium]
MKIKTIIALAGLLGSALFSTAFVQKPNPSKTLENAAEKESFLEFLSQFQKVELPFSIGLNDLEGYQAYRDTKAKPAAKSKHTTPLKATRFIPGSEHYKFSRMGPPEMVAVARFYPSCQTVAVVYSSKQPFGDDLYLNYQMLVYDLKGNLLTKAQDKKGRDGAFTLAYSGVENSMTCTIDAAGKISQSTYKNQWKKDVANHGYDGNKLVDFKLEKTTDFKLDEKGNIGEAKHATIASRATP